MTDAVALEVEIEDAWRDLINSCRPRTYYLTSRDKLRFGQAATEASHHSEEIGTYRRSVTLADFRADVFFVFDHRKGKGHVR